MLLDALERLPFITDLVMPCLWPDAFANQMQIAREEYAAEIAVGQFPQATGDWALFTSLKLDELLALQSPKIARA